MGAECGGTGRTYQERQNLKKKKSGEKSQDPPGGLKRLSQAEGRGSGPWTKRGMRWARGTRCNAGAVREDKVLGLVKSLGAGVSQGGGRAGRTLSKRS